MKNRFRLFGAIIATILIVGCSDEDEIEIVTEISVGTGITPSISWTGGNVSLLEVVRSSDNSSMWTISVPEDQLGFPSPVTYGQVPTGVFEDYGPDTLVIGTAYIVEVISVESSDATKTFTP